mgnify:CR=1 FL=1
MSRIERFFLSLLVLFQAAIVVTGGAVRLTGSGLGCPTWPECTPGSITPLPDQIEGKFHSWIEFGNRLLTFALLLAALAVIIIVIRNRAKELRWLALGQIAGIFGQGVLGGITVLTDLNPIPVAGHFLLSIILIAGALSLRQRALGKDLKIQLRSTTKKLAQAVVALSVLVIALGTIVTGTGPHAGDAQARALGAHGGNCRWRQHWLPFGEGAGGHQSGQADRARQRPRPANFRTSRENHCAHRRCRRRKPVARREYR